VDIEHVGGCLVFYKRKQCQHDNDAVTVFLTYRKATIHVWEQVPEGSMPMWVIGHTQVSLHYTV